MLKSAHQNFKNWIILMLIIQGNVNSAKDNTNEYSEDEYLHIVSKLGCVCLRWTDWVQIGTAYNLYHSPQTYDNLIKTGIVIAQTNKMDICIVPVSTDCRVLVPKLKPEINLNQESTTCPYVLNDMASDDGHVQIRFLCWDANCPCLQWSKWYNHDRPNDEGDFELLHHTITKYDWPCPQGTSPLDVECRTAEGKLMSDGNDKSIECDLNGFRCLNDLQGDNCNCDDYKIRFLCVKQHQFPDSFQLEEREKEFQYKNCSKSNCPKENPVGRSRGPSSSTLEIRAAFSEEIPTPVKRIYGYGPCQIPLTCPRINLIKLGRVFVNARQQAKERSKTRPKVDCKRNPNAKECNLRSRHERQPDVADSNRKRREITKHDIYLPENISFVGPMERHWRFIPSTKPPQSIKRIATTVPVIVRPRKNSPKWKNSIHQTLPPYDQYHYNYPLMMPSQQQEMNEHYYFSRNRQLPEKDDDGSEDHKKSYI